METGKVKWFGRKEGFGFIRADRGEPDVFVHISIAKLAGMSNLSDGQRLSYELETDRQSGRVSATNLKSLQ
jgi:CspA family cold shock protein